MRPPFGLITAAMGVPRAGYAQGWTAAERFSPQPIPVIAVLEAAEPAPGTRSGYRGRLRLETPFIIDQGAGERGPEPLSEIVAEGVGSFHLVTSPLLGAVYGVEEGPRSGLWFSAL